MKIDLIIPVLNEETQLEGTIRCLLASGVDGWPEGVRLIIADNGSTDGTSEIARRLASEFSVVSHLHLKERGRGRALKAAWSASTADVLAYMDVDLSTDLKAFPKLVSPLLDGHADVSIGCRLHPQARVVRGWKREFISRSYNQLAQGVTGTRVRDLQCGFKAITRHAAEHLLPLVEDTGWFFDTELLLLAEHFGYRIHQQPVSWKDDPDTRVKFFRTAREDWKGLLRMRRTLRKGQLGVAPRLQSDLVP